MEWFKVKTNHTLIEYSDFTEKQIGAWILAMALTASLEKLPTEAQLKKYIHGSTLKSLELGLSLHGVTLELVLSKVLDDVEYALSLKETNRSKIANWRKKKENVTSNVTSNEPDKIREDKIREDKSIRAKRFTPPTQLELTEYLKEKSIWIDTNKFIDFYESKGWMVGKNKMKDWKAAVRNWHRSSDKKEQPFKTKSIPLVNDTLRKMDQWAKEQKIYDGVKNETC